MIAKLLQELSLVEVEEQLNPSNQGENMDNMV